MRYVISLLSRLKPWLLFFITVTPMVLAVTLFSPFPADPLSDIEGFKSQFSVMMAASLPGMLAFYAWIMTVGVVCNRSIENSYRKPERLFRFSVPFAMLYLTVAIWVFPEAVLSENMSLLAAVVFPVHFVASILLFYSVAFSARSLAMLAEPRSPGFWRSFRYFLALLYFPIGLWFVQPKVNAISAPSHNGR